MTFAESMPLKLIVMHYVLMNSRCREILYGSVGKRGKKMGVGLVLLFFNSLPEDGIQVPKYVEVIL